MTKQHNALRAGLFMLFSVAAAVAIAVAIAGTGRFTETLLDRQVGFALEDDIGGLNVGDDVRIGGFKVGVIRSIEVLGYATTDPNQKPRILVTFSMPARYLLRNGARIEIQGTLTGQSWLNLDDLGAGPEIKADTVLVGQPSSTTLLTRALGRAAPEITAVISDVHQRTVPKLDNAVDSANALLTDARGRVGDVITRYDNVTDRAAEMMLAIHELVGPSTTDFHGLVSDLHHISSTVNDRLPNSLGQIDALLAKIDTSMTSVNAALVDVRATAVGARDSVNTVRSLIIDNRGKFESMITSLRQTSDNLKNASAEIRRSPWRLLYKPGPDEVANLNVFDAARAFADGADNLNDAAKALRDALNDPKADSAQIHQLLNKLDQSFSGFQEVQTKLEKEVRP
jgi:ABC-type transporter Mla subunit MlaD